MSDEQRKRIGIKSGAARTEKMEQKVWEAMKVILHEIKSNEGIYPNNGGEVSMAELARRADISESSFYKKDEKNLVLKEMAVQWLETLKKKETIGRTRVKKTHAERTKACNEKLKDLENSHILLGLELQECQAVREKADKANKKKISLLEDEISALRDALAKAGASKITPFPKGNH
jgi:hypothetical protein